MTPTLREAVETLRDWWRVHERDYAVSSVQASDIGRAMAQDARASMCRDHADELDAILAAHPDATPLTPALAPLLVQSWREDHQAAAQSEAKLSVEDYVKATRIIRLCDSHEVLRAGLARVQAERDEAAQEIARLRKALTWQPIETAPKDGTQVLLWAPGSIQERDESRPFIHASHWVSETWDRWEDAGPRTRRLVSEDASHWASYEDPTHWMPLPDPPAAAAPAGARTP